MQVINVEQGTSEWLQARLGKITGTRLKSVMGSPAVQQTLIYELIAEQISGQPEVLFTNDAMRWGTDHEDDAVVAYEKKKKVRADKVGFCISDEFSFLGLSPDRLIEKKGKFTKAVEVKAPTTKTVVKYMLDGGVPEEYKWQVVNYFLVCPDLKELDFIIYDPRIIDPTLQLIIINVKRKDVAKNVEAAKVRLMEFREKWKDAYNKIKK